ncbi:hypothetical protein MBLNU459_g6459t1 [Dothideomycetes sp. NU459]
MSRFVSGGTVDEPVERDDAWLKAQQEVEARRRQKEDESRQDGGKSLYETLQANKAAKQEAFEESIRLKNQFRSLDDDEVEFLDSVLESTRAKESAVRKETAEQLELFRKQQEESEKAALAANPDPDAQAAGSDTWAVSARKRKRAREREGFLGVKLRRTSSAADQPDTSKPADAVQEESTNPQKEAVASTNSSSPSVVAEVTKAVKPDNSPRTATASPLPLQPAPAALGLGAYSSDED